MEKFILDALLTQEPRSHSSHRSEKTNRSHLGNRRKNDSSWSHIFEYTPLQLNEP